MTFGAGRGGPSPRTTARRPARVATPESFKSSATLRNESPRAHYRLQECGDRLSRTPLARLEASASVRWAEEPAPLRAGRCSSQARGDPSAEGWPKRPVGRCSDARPGTSPPTRSPTGPKICPRLVVNTECRDGCSRNRRWSASRCTWTWKADSPPAFSAATHAKPQPNLSNKRSTSRRCCRHLSSAGSPTPPGTDTPPNYVLSRSTPLVADGRRSAARCRAPDAGLACQG
jgi:hypothetical protein